MLWHGYASATPAVSISFILAGLRSPASTSRSRRHFRRWISALFAPFLAVLSGRPSFTYDTHPLVGIEARIGADVAHTANARYPVARDRRRLAAAAVRRSRLVLLVARLRQPPSATTYRLTISSSASKRKGFSSHPSD